MPAQPLARGVIRYVTLSTVDPGFTRIWLKLLPLPPEYPETVGAVAEALQLKMVPAVADEKPSENVSPEHSDDG